MLKRAASALALSTILAGAAVAQTSTTTTTTTPATAPAATAPMASGSTTSSSGQFVTEQAADQYRASKFVGLGIYGPDNQRVGDINEILIDGSGNARAVVIGVGGFLGIGEKNVAVPFSAVEWKMTRPSDQTAASTNPAMTPATRPAGTAADATGSTTAATTATPATTTGAAHTPAETAAANGYPDHGMIKLTKADLQNAPAFKWYSDNKTGPSNATTTPMTPARP